MSTMTSSNPATLRAPQRAPTHRGINGRMIFFIAALVALLGGIGYVVVRPMLTGGIENRGDRYEVNLKALGNFNFNQQAGALSDVPEKYRKLDGQRVELSGFIVSDEQARGAGAHFQIVYDVNKCCFNGPPQVQERVFCKVPAGRKFAHFEYTQLVRLIGKLHVRVVKDPESGTILSVYDLEVESLERA